MRQALPYFVVLILCGCAGTIAPRRQVARHSPAPAVQSAAPPAAPIAPGTFSTPAAPVPASDWRVPVSGTAAVPPDIFRNSGSSLPVIPMEKPHSLIDPGKTTVSGSLSVAVGYEHDSRVDRIGRSRTTYGSAR
ncbi:MAG: hypothetical protein V4726_23555 [Verrucomicrobiota bacterium]